MFFPTQRNLPRTGDAVIFRPYSRPYTVTDRSSRDGYVWLSLDGHPEPVIVEALNWAPLPGCRVEVLYQPYLVYLQGRLEHHNARLWTEPQNRAEVEDKIAKVRKALARSAHYRVGLLLQVDGEWAKVQFTNEVEVIPLCCVAVVKKPRKALEAKQLELAS